MKVIIIVDLFGNSNVVEWYLLSDSAQHIYKLHIQIQNIAAQYKWSFDVVINGRCDSHGVDMLPDMVKLIHVCLLDFRNQMFWT